MQAARDSPGEAEGSPVGQVNQHTNLWSSLTKEATVAQCVCIYSVDPTECNWPMEKSQQFRYFAQCFSETPVLEFLAESMLG